MIYKRLNASIFFKQHFWHRLYAALTTQIVFLATDYM